MIELLMNTFKKLKLGTDGMSIMQSIVLVGVFGGISLGVMRMTGLQKSIKKTNELQFEISNLREMVQRNLSNPKNCVATFSVGGKGTGLKTLDSDTITTLNYSNNDDWSSDGEILGTFGTAAANFQNKIQVKEANFTGPTDSGQKVLVKNMTLTVEYLDQDKPVRGYGSAFLIPFTIVFIRSPENSNLDACFAQIDATSSDTQGNVIYGVTERLCQDITREMGKSARHDGNVVNITNSYVARWEAISNASGKASNTDITTFQEGTCFNLPELITDDALVYMCSQLSPTGYQGTDAATGISNYVPQVVTGAGGKVIGYQCKHRYEQLNCNDLDQFPNNYDRWVGTKMVDGKLTNIFDNWVLQGFEEDGTPRCVCIPRPCRDSQNICATTAIGSDWCGNLCLRNNRKVMLEDIVTDPDNRNSGIDQSKLSTALGYTPTVLSGSINNSDFFKCVRDSRDDRNFSTSRTQEEQTRYYEQNGNSVIGSPIANNPLCGEVPLICPTTSYGGTSNTKVEQYADAEDNDIQSKYCPKRKRELIGGTYQFTDNLYYIHFEPGNGCPGYCPSFQGTKAVDPGNEQDQTDPDNCKVDFDCPTDWDENLLCSGIAVKGGTNSNNICLIGKNLDPKDSNGNSRKQHTCTDAYVIDEYGKICDGGMNSIGVLLGTEIKGETTNPTTASSTIIIPNTCPDETVKDRYGNLCPSLTGTRTATNEEREVTCFGMPTPMPHRSVDGLYSSGTNACTDNVNLGTQVATPAQQAQFCDGDTVTFRDSHNNLCSDNVNKGTKIPDWVIPAAPECTSNDDTTGDDPYCPEGCSKCRLPNGTTSTNPPPADTKDCSSWAPVCSNMGESCTINSCCSGLYCVDNPVTGDVCSDCTVGSACDTSADCSSCGVALECVKTAVDPDALGSCQPK